MYKRTIMALLLVAALGLGGCYTTPVRHLTADIGMVKKGVSTEEDVLIYMGDPDRVEELKNGDQRWYYSQKEETALEKIPWAGKELGTPGVITAIITFHKKKVTAVSYDSRDPDEVSWEKD